MATSQTRRHRGKPRSRASRLRETATVSGAGFRYAQERYPCRDANAMSHKHDQLLRAIFQDPISCNIHWREIESLLNHVGADIESLSGARIRVKLNGAEGILHRPHHGNTLDRSAVRHLREYLAHARMTPSQYEAAREAQH